MSNKLPTVGNNLLALRKQRGLTQDQVASAIGVVRKTIFNWESGKSSPDSQEIERAAKYFNVPVRVIIGETITHPHTHQSNSGVLHDVVPGSSPTREHCLNYFTAFLATCESSAEVSWTLVELREHFPLNKFKRGRLQPLEPSSVVEDAEDKIVGLNAADLLKPGGGQSP